MLCNFLNSENTDVAFLVVDVVESVGLESMGVFIPAMLETNFGPSVISDAISRMSPRRLRNLISHANDEATVKLLKNTEEESLGRIVSSPDNEGWNLILGHCLNSRDSIDALARVVGVDLAINGKGRANLWVKLFGSVILNIAEEKAGLEEAYFNLKEDMRTLLERLSQYGLTGFEWGSSEAVPTDKIHQSLVPSFVGPDLVPRSHAEDLLNALLGSYLSKIMPSKAVEGILGYHEANPGAMN